MKWILLLPILCALQEVKGYPSTKCENDSYRSMRLSPNIQSLTEVSSVNNDSNNFERSWTPQFTLSLRTMFNNTLAYMTRKLEVLEESYKQITERLKEIVDELMLNKEKKQPVTSESTVLNDNKLEYFNQTESVPDELIVTQTPALVKDDVKEKSAEQGDKEDTITFIKNDENAITSSSSEKTVFTTSTNQAETMITKNGQITEKPETLHENENSQTTSLEEEPKSEADESEENAQQSDNEKMMKEKDP